MNLTFIRTYVHHTTAVLVATLVDNNNLTPAEIPRLDVTFRAHFVFRFSFIHSRKITATPCRP